MKKRLHHFAYDGVYASSEERKGNRGGLDLASTVAQLLDLSESDITGQHDLAHALQLILGDLFKKEKTADKKIRKMMQSVYAEMNEFSCGKAKKIWEEFAAENSLPTLTMKSSQETRFARAELRANLTMLRNLVCLYNIHGEKAMAASMALPPDNTAAKEALAHQERLSDGKFIVQLLGYCCILQFYSETSICSQSSTNFPTTVLQSVNKLLEKLEALAITWTWPSTPLEYSSMASPKTLIENMLNGFYSSLNNSGSRRYKRSQKVTAINEEKRRNQALLDAGLEEGDLHVVGLEKSSSLFNPVEEDEEDIDNPDEFFDGQFPVSLPEDDLKEVEEHLSYLCGRVAEALGQRIKPYDIIYEANEVFCGDFSWTEDEDIFQDNARVKLSKLFKHLESERDKLFFNLDEALIGYTLYTKYVQEMRRKNSNMTQEMIYEKFYLKYHTVEGCSSFINLYQFINTKTFSEAVAETVGSIMKMHTGRCRNLHETNFDKEIFIEYNSPPLHIVKESLLKEIVQEKIENGKEYVSKNPQRLTYVDLGATVGSFRKNAENSSHLPCSFFLET